MVSGGKWFPLLLSNNGKKYMKIVVDAAIQKRFSVHVNFLFSGWLGP